MRQRAWLLATLILSAAGLPAAAQEVVVLKGGTRIALKKPMVRQGERALLTRSDGVLFSVPVSEIDAEATRAARAAAQAPKAAAAAPADATTPAEAARAAQEGPKARVRITDADVAHEFALETPPAARTAPDASGAKTGASAGVGEANIQVAGFTQEESGGALIVRGSLQNSGAGRAVSVRLTVTALDADGKDVGTSNASLSKGSLEGGESVDFATNIPIPAGSPPAVSVRFSPQWIGGPPPPPAFPASPSSSPSRS